MIRLLISLGVEANHNSLNVCLQSEVYLRMQLA